MKLNNISILIAFFVFSTTGKAKQKIVSDRTYWTDLLYQMSAPVLKNMSNGELVKNMTLEVSPDWGNREKRVSYMEAFGRLMNGIAPYLALPDDDTSEGMQRKQLREWALKSYANAVDSQSPDCLLWDKEGQTLVDAAFLANSFLLAPKQLWEPLDDVTKQRYIADFTQLHRVNVPYNNWLLFSATIESFLMTAHANYDPFRLKIAINKMNEWYLGDGWYGDGPKLAFNYYNSYVIQPMLVQVLEVLVANKTIAEPKDLDLANKRMQRYSEILERLISPEASFPAFGRSIPYRTAAFQPLALLALRKNLPKSLPEGQVRYALTSVMKRMFANPENFRKDGFLALGFVGHQPDAADYYTNTGSLYLASLIFLPLGLPANDSFWTSQPQDWTAKKAWSGQAFPKDHAIGY